MYYESKVHKVMEVESAESAARLIKIGNLNDYEALKWVNENGVFYAVDDTHADDRGFGEVAIIKEIEFQFIQKESITAAWIDSVEKLAAHFKDAETSEFNRKTDLIIGKATTQIAMFECGCCGIGFRDNVAKQLEYDCDSGFGICPDCEQYH